MPAPSQGLVGKFRSKFFGPSSITSRSPNKGYHRQHGAGYVLQPDGFFPVDAADHDYLKTPSGRSLTRRSPSSPPIGQGRKAVPHRPNARSGLHRTLHSISLTLCPSWAGTQAPRQAASPAGGAEGFRPAVASEYRKRPMSRSVMRSRNRISILVHGDVFDRGPISLMHQTPTERLTSPPDCLALTPAAKA